MWISRKYTYIPFLNLSPTPTLIPPLQVTTEQWGELPGLYSFPQPVYFTRARVYMSVLLSQFGTPSLSPLCPHVHFQHLRLYSCPAKRNHLDHLSRFHIHTLIYGICFSLSDLLHSIWRHSEVFKYLLIAECSCQMKSYVGTEPWKMTKSFISIYLYFFLW